MRATLTKLEGVENVKVDFAKKVATVTVKKDGSLTEGAVKTALKKRGFGVSSFEAPATSGESEYIVTVSGMT